MMPAIMPTQAVAWPSGSSTQEAVEQPRPVPTAWPSQPKATPRSSEAVSQHFSIALCSQPQPSGS